MALTSAEQMRRWSGPAILTYGFRPFFLFASIWAAMAMAIWIAMLAGVFALPSRFDPVSWHAHEFLFGYLGAVVAGFLLTAVPNWTGRLPVVGWRLGGLVALWLAGRLAVAVSALIPAWAVIVVDLAFPLMLAGVILREIVAGKNWNNLIVLSMLGVFALANLIFHIEALRGGYAAQGYGLRLGLATGIMMVTVIGGRIVPSFTRNWLVKAGSEARPAAPMQWFDKLTILLTLAGLLLWVVQPVHLVTGYALLLVALVQGVRLFRWKGMQTAAEPLLWVLHAGYGLVPLGAALLALGILFPQWIGPVAMQHVWMAGAIGLMTLAVMTRATLGHSGQALHAGPGTTALYVALVAAVAARLAAGIWPGMATLLYNLAGLLWIGAFLGFALLYGPLLLRAKPKQG
jgi:uncharacterized protein involved in response to NO